MTPKEKSTVSKFLITLAVSFIPELFFSWVVGRIITISLWYIWLSLQVIKLFLWVIRSVVGYLTFHLVWKRSVIDDIYASLVQRKYPNPTKYGPISEIADEFFFDVMEDNQLEWGIRLDAAQTYATLKTPQGFFEHMRRNKIFISAIEKYHEINFSGQDYLDLSSIYTAEDVIKRIESLKKPG